MILYLPKHKFSWKGISTPKDILSIENDDKKTLEKLKSYPIEFGEIKDQYGNIINNNNIDENDILMFNNSMPSPDWLKSDIKKYMDINNIGYNSGDTKKDLLQKIVLSNK